MKINEYVANMVPRRYTIGQAADLIGRDPATLKRWKREGIYQPSDHRKFGKLDVNLYTEDDIKAMKALLGNEVRPGRPAMPRDYAPVA